MVENQKLFRVSRLKEHSLSTLIEDKIIDEIKKIAPKVRAILVSDFVYGVITPRILETIADMADQYHLKLFGDLQCSSQIGKVTKFTGYHLLCPTEREARIALGSNEEGIEWVANTLMNRTQSKQLLMKLGAQGFIAYEDKRDDFVNTQHFPALTENPVDVSGAGDSLLAAVAVGLCSGASLMQASAIGACMASLAVQTVGNLPISRQNLIDNVKSSLI